MLSFSLLLIAIAFLTIADHFKSPVWAAIGAIMLVLAASVNFEEEE